MKHESMTEKLSREILRMNSFSSSEARRKSSGKAVMGLRSNLVTTEMELGSPTMPTIMNEILETNNDYNDNDSLIGHPFHQTLKSKTQTTSKRGPKKRKKVK